MSRTAVVPTLLLMAGAVLAANPTHIGEKAPPFEVRETAGAALPFEKLGDVTGDVVLLVYLRTACPGCRAIFPSLTQTAEKFACPDVHVVAATNDSRNLVRRYLYHKSDGRKMTYPISIRANGNWQVHGVPMAFVIGRDGKVAWGGHPGQGYTRALEAAIAAPDPTMPEVPRALAKSAALIGQGRFVQALAAARKAKENEETADFGEWLERKVSRHFDRRAALADRYLEMGDVKSAESTLEEAVAAFEGTEFAVRADRLLSDLRSRDGFAESRAAWAELHSVAAAARKGKPGLKAGISRLKGLVKTADDAKLVRAAKDLLEVLETPWTQEDAATMGGLLRNPAGGCTGD